MAKTGRGMVAANIWTARIIPIVLFGMILYVTYVIVGPLCVDYLLAKHNNPAAAIPILITYFLPIILTLASFGRLLHLTIFEPPYVPLGPAAIRDQDAPIHSRRDKRRHGTDGIGSGEYNSHGVDIDSPGLEKFYTKDIFVSEMDGKPKWCTHCANWKPDRCHHCSSSGRCIERMDHFCPWVGGPIGENNFKFFVQFTFYTAITCIQIVIVLSTYIARQRSSRDESINTHFIVALAMAALFGLFTAGMTATSVELVIRNQTQVERLGAETRVHILAVIKPEFAPQQSAITPSQQILSSPEIIYPLGTGPHPSLNQNSSLLQPLQNNGDVRPGSPPPSRDLSEGSTIVAAPNIFPQSAPLDPPEAQWPSKEIAERDRKATRTFNILKMPELGYNPWDLGSSLLNWETVMGYSFLDWVLPIQRSPCCNHEETESYYQVGPMVDLLRYKYGLISESEIRAYGGRRRTERIDPAVLDEQTDASNAQQDGQRRRRRKRTSASKEDKSSSTDQPVELSDLAERNK